MSFDKNPWIINEFWQNPSKRNGWHPMHKINTTIKFLIWHFANKLIQINIKNTMIINTIANMIFNNIFPHSDVGVHYVEGGWLFDVGVHTPVRTMPLCHYNLIREGPQKSYKGYYRNFLNINFSIFVNVLHRNYYRVVVFLWTIPYFIILHTWPFTHTQHIPSPSSLSFLKVNVPHSF